MTNKVQKRLNNWDEPLTEDDPLASLPNLFDIVLVLVVSLIVMIFSAFKMEELFDVKTNLTIMKKNDKGEMQIITKEGKKIKVQKITKESMEGEGSRLGVAYQLKNGSTIYVPD